MEFIKSPVIHIKSYPCTYNIYIGNYFQNGLDDILVKYLYKDNNVVVIYDIKLENLYLHILINVLNKLKFNYLTIPLEAKETNKSFRNVNDILNTILNSDIKRRSTIIALGGGIIGDIAGLISSITLRGVNYINIPTTLLSVVDSSIGGKNGVNHQIGKNTIGTFYNPKAVIIDPNILKTLDKRNFLAGFAEVIKCSLINNKELFYYLESNLNLINTYDTDFLNTIIKEPIFTKKLLVEHDFFDTKNQRILLNLGHTFGHALEKMNNYKSSLLHGEAVAIGLCMAAKFSSYIGLLDHSKANKIFNFINNLNLPTDYKKFFKDINTNENFVNTMLKDKKSSNQNINLVLLKDIGKATLYKNILPTQVLNFLKEVYT